MSKISTRGTAVQDAIADRRDFDTHGALTGREISYPNAGATGALPSEWAGRLYEEHPVYIVRSYSTPIAWWSGAHGWTVPAVKYSVTTSKHQSQVRIALAGL